LLSSRNHARSGVTPEDAVKKTATAKVAAASAAASAAVIAAVALVASPAVLAQQRPSVMQSDFAFTPPDLPPEALPGQCYARVWVPEITESSLELGKCVETTQARRETRVVPPLYEDFTERVLIKEAHTQRVVIPARYQEVTEQILVAEAFTENYMVEAVWREVEERVLVRPARTEWKQGTEVYGIINEGRIREARRNETTGVVWCLVEIDAEYQMIKRRVLVTEARVEQRQVPAVYRTVTRQRLIEAERIEVREHAAQYETVVRKRLVKAGYTELVEVAAECRPVPTIIVRQPARVDWREVLCEINATPDVFRRIQAGLRAKGYTVDVDGRMGPRTEAAIVEYQTRERLPTGGLTLTLMESLGIEMGGGSEKDSRPRPPTATPPAAPPPAAPPIAPRPPQAPAAPKAAPKAEPKAAPIVPR